MRNNTEIDQYLLMPLLPHSVGAILSTCHWYILQAAVRLYCSCFRLREWS